MKRLVEFPLEEGGSIVVEIDEPETGGTVRAGREDKIEKARETFEDPPLVFFSSEHEGFRLSPQWPGFAIHPPIGMRI